MIIRITLILTTIVLLLVGIVNNGGFFTSMSAAMLVFLLPVYVGNSLHNNNNLSVKLVVVDFLRGSAMLFTLFTLFSLTRQLLFNNLISLQLFVSCFLGVFTFINIIKIARNFRIDVYSKKNLFHKDILVLIFLIIVSSVVFLGIFRAGTPYPYVTNWDAFHHTTLTNNLAMGKFSFLLSEISDTFTFNSYLPLYHVLIAVPHILTNSDVLSMFWFLDYFHFLITVVISYWAGKKIFKSSLAGLITGLLAVFVFESNVVYAGFFFIPQTVAAVLSAYFIVHKISKDSDSLSNFEIILSSLVICAFHFIIGAVYVLTYVIVKILGLVNQKIDNSIFRLAIVTTMIVFSIAALYLGFHAQLTLSLRNDAVDFIFTGGEKISFFYQWYGILPLALIPLGIIYFIKHRFRQNYLFLSVTFFLLGLSLMPFSYGLKFFAIGRYFFNILLAGGIYFFARNIKSPWFKNILGLFLVAGFLPVFIVNSLNFLQSSFHNNIYSFVSPLDFEAIKWVQNNYNSKNTFLISDPQTQNIFEAGTLINTQGGAFPNNDTVKLLDSINNETDTHKTYTTLLQIRDNLDNSNKEHILFVTGGRYFTWQRFPKEWKESYFYQVWTGQDVWLMDYETIRLLSESPYFRIVFQNSENVILELI